MSHNSSEIYLKSFEDLMMKSHNRTRKGKRKKSTLTSYNSSKALQSLMELAIPTSTKITLSKLLIKGELTSVELLSAKRHSVVMHGKVNRSKAKFASLSSDDVIVKAFINCDEQKLCEKADHERLHLENNRHETRPKFILQSNNIVLMSMIGEDKPAPTLKEIMKANERSIELIYSEVMEHWSQERTQRFDASNILYHGGKWWSVGFSDSLEIKSLSDGCLSFDFESANLKKFVRMFCKAGLSRQKAEEGFLKCHGNYDWLSTRLTQGIFKTTKHVYLKSRRLLSKF